MKLKFICSSCKKENNYKPVVATRGDLQMKVGDEVDVTCDNCGTLDKKHINRIDAVVDTKKIIFALIISVIVTMALFSFYGAIGTISGAIPIFMWMYENKAVKDFNSYKIRRR